MGQQQSIQKCNFEDIQKFIIQGSNLQHQQHQQYLLINTLPKNEQTCLIKGTIPSHEEERVINEALNGKNKYTIQIIIYGRNTNDESVYIKYRQLLSLGFVGVYVYVGGLFEWLCLQDIYGDNDDEFPTTMRELDILKYKPETHIKNNYYLTN
jgi:hypothetical protein